MLTNQRSGAEAPEERLPEEIPSSTDVPGATTPARSRRELREAAVAHSNAKPNVATESAVERVAAPVKPSTAVAKPSTAVAKPTAARKVLTYRPKPLRSLVTLAMVGGLIATVALPAYGAFRPAAQAQTLQQVAADNAQSLVVASEVTGASLTRDSYSATTAEEIAKKKAEEAAAARAREEAAAAAAAAAAATAAASAPSSSSSSSSASSGGSLNMVAPGTGAVRWPLANFILGQRVGDRGGAHEGTDMLAPAMEPIYATAAGVVSVSSESHGGWGVTVAIDHEINGQSVNSLYGHMTYGTRQVSVGQYVEAGQLIGYVGSTGRSTANHLHFEIRINGSIVDSYAWLEQNAS